MDPPFILKQCIKANIVLQASQQVFNICNCLKLRPLTAIPALWGRIDAVIPSAQEPCEVTPIWGFCRLTGMSKAYIL
jgi:hypothetical protein